MFVAVTMAAEYLQIEYNKGSLEIYEFGKCYCFVEDACYTYEKKVEGEKTTVLEREYKLETKCDVEEPEGSKPYEVGKVLDKDMKFKIITELPDHEFYYVESMNEQCNDEEPKAKCLMTKDNCERGFSDEETIYRTYRLSQDKTKIDIAQYSDNTCSTPITTDGNQKGEDYKANECIEEEGSRIKFVDEPYTIQQKEYLQIEYNKG